MSNEFYHFGIKGQKWYIRRYQNEDGSLTPEGKKRYNENSSNSITDLSNEELKNRINRLRSESEYKKLLKETSIEDAVRNSLAAKKVTIKVLNKIGDASLDIAVNAYKNIGTQAATYVLGSFVNKKFNANIVNLGKGQKDK